MARRDLFVALAAVVILGAVCAEDVESRLRVEPDVAVLNATTIAPELDVMSASAGAFAKDEAVGMSLAALAIFVAAGGGTGGGGVLDPIYILIMGLEPKVAIPLSSITIFGGALANVLLNVRKAKHGNPTAPLIDWDIILVMQPMLLMGATIGTYLNAIIPTWLLCILLVLVLSATGIRTLQKAILARQKENWGCCATTPIAESAILLALPTTSYLEEEAKAEQRAQIVIPWSKIGALAGLFTGIVLLRLLTGGKNFSSPLGIEKSSFIYPFVAALPILFLSIFSHFSLKNIVATYHKQQSPHHVLAQDEVHWTPHSIRFFPIISVSAGLVAGMFGIGGGILNAPLLLELGIEPSAASALTSTTVLFSTAMSSFSYVLLGSFNFTFAQVMLPIGFITTYVGHVCLEKIVRRYNCPSLIVFSMAIIVLVSAVAMSVESIRAVLEA